MIDLHDYYGKHIVITFKDGQKLSGKVVTYCSALDDPDGIPNIGIKRKPRDEILINITANDIDEIEDIQIVK